MDFGYPDLGDFCDVAADVLGTTPEQIEGLPNIGLAESALGAPRAGFGDVELYPTLLEKAAILLERLARNHPLLDGNKRTAFFVTGVFLENNGCPLQDDLPDVDVPMVERIAAGEADQSEVIAWLAERTGAKAE